MKRLILPACCLFVSFLISAQKANDFYQDSKSAVIITAKQETEDAIWIGTNNGLWRINKNNHKIVHLTESNSVLPSNHITAITTSSKNNVYAATDKGIFRFDGYAYLVLNTENSDLPNAKITSMVCDKSDNLWIGTAGMGLILFHHYKCTFFNSSNSALTSNKVTEVLTDKDGNIDVVLANHDKVRINIDEMAVLNGKDK